DHPVHRRWLRARGIVPRIARRGVDSSERLGRYRWTIERTLARLTGYRRLTIRYKRHGEHFAGFLQLAAALTRWNKLAK
ncbi:IS5/IS1182 family transposase, partial [Rhodococcus aetherivorans]